MLTHTVTCLATGRTIASGTHWPSVKAAVAERYHCEPEQIAITETDGDGDRVTVRGVSVANLVDSTHKR